MTKSLHAFGVFFCGLASLTWLIPVRVMAADGQGTRNPAVASRPLVRDVALGSNGSIRGQLLDAQGQARGNQIVVVHRQGVQPRQARTDQNGRFQVSGLTGGTYQIATVDAATLCRCWTEKTAPPAAQEELLLVSGDGIQRGQYPIGDILFSAPVLIGLVIAAAVAIPIAVHNSQDDAS